MAETKVKKTAGPSTLALVVEAIKTLDDRKGASIQAIRAYIIQKYPDRSPELIKTLMKKAVARGLETGVIIRPARAAGTGLTGRLKINKDKKETKPKKKEAKSKVEKTKTAKTTKTPKTPKKPLKKKLAPSPKKGAGKKPAPKKSPKKSPQKKTTASKSKAKTTPKAKKAKTTPKAKPGSAKAKK